jgi:hypothetical protein
MTKNVEARLSLLKGCEHRKKRIYAPLELEKYKALAKLDCRATFFEDMAEREIPNFIGDDLFGFNQSHVV